MNSDLKAAVLERCRKMEIPLVGVAGTDRWENPPFLPWMPEEFYPQSIFPEARSVIVIGLPVHLPVLETSPSIYYHELYKTVNTLLDQYTYRLASFLNDRGYLSVFVPRDGYGSIEALQKNPVAFFSHRHAALLAGLGTFGVNNTLLTPEYGPGSGSARSSPPPTSRPTPCSRKTSAPGACSASAPVPRARSTTGTTPRASPTGRPARETAPNSPGATSPPAGSASKSARWGRTGGTTAAVPPQGTGISATGVPGSMSGNSAGCKPAC